MIVIGDDTVTSSTGYSPFSPFNSKARIETSAAIYAVFPSGVVTQATNEGVSPVTIDVTQRVTYLELF